MGNRIIRNILIGLTAMMIILYTPISTIMAAAEPGALDYNAIDNYVTTEMKHGRIKGMAISIVHGDEVIYQKGYGTAGDNREVTVDTPFGIGSVGKTFTALAIRQLINEGKLEENTSVNDYVKGFQPTYQGEAVTITIRQLLTHTSGISQVQGVVPYLFNAAYSNEDVVDRSKNLKLDILPGTEYTYSNLNYVILGRTVEIISGQSFADYICKNIFQRLGMTHSYYNEKPAKDNGLSDGYVIFYGIPVKSHYPVPTGSISAGYVFSSVEDMSHYLISYLNQGWYNGVSAVTDNPMEQPADPLENGFQGGWYDDIWFENNGYPKNDLYLNSYGYNGAAPNYTSSIKINQETKYAVVVMNNTMDENDFYQGDIDSSTVCAGIMEYLISGKLPANTIMKGSYERLIPAAVVLLLLFIYAYCSIRMEVHKKEKKDKVYTQDVKALKGIKDRNEIRAKKVIKDRNDIRVKKVSLYDFIFAFSDFILPISALVFIPCYNDSSWSWLIAIWPEVNYLILFAIGWLLLIGLMKILIRIFYKKQSMI
jgi:CubicO group peptidase (beta-lactamase class C family)